MKRFGQVIRIKPERFEEYRAAHAQVWPEVLDMILLPYRKYERVVV